MISWIGRNQARTTVLNHNWSRGVMEQLLETDSSLTSGWNFFVKFIQLGERNFEKFSCVIWWSEVMGGMRLGGWVCQLVRRRNKWMVFGWEVPRIKFCLHVKSACASASKFNIESMVTQMQMQRMGPRPILYNTNVTCKHLHLVLWIPLFTSHVDAPADVMCKQAFSRGEMGGKDMILVETVRGDCSHNIKLRNSTWMQGIQLYVAQRPFMDKRVWFWFHYNTRQMKANLK